MSGKKKNKNMSKEKEPKIEQPTLQEQREYVSMRDNDATIVSLAGVKKKYKIYWLKNGQLVKLSRLLIRKQATDDKDVDEKSNEFSQLEEIVADSKLACKAAAIIVLHGFWKLHLKYWLLWRWFYYIRQYSCQQLQPILNAGKKKVPQIQFYTAIMSLTEVKGTLMNMTMREAEHILRELRSAQDSQTESSSNGSTSPATSSSD